jgi:predicted aspartyl protease
VKYRALTIKSPGVARSVIMPVVASQYARLCEEYGLEKVDADVYALVDTGATNTAISNTLAASLKLSIVDQCSVKAAGGTHRSNIYLIDVLLRDMIKFTNIRATEFVKTDDQFDIILGMDVLMLGDLALTNHNHQTFLSFKVPPGAEHIDFVAEIDGLSC